VARLHSRIYLHFVGVLLVVGVTTAVVFAVGTRDSFRREIAIRMTEHLATLAAERIAEPAALAARLREMHEHLGIDIRVTTVDGRTLAVAGADDIPRLTPAEEAELRARQLVMRRHPIGYTAVPVRKPGSGAIVGFVEAAAPRHLGPPPWRAVLFVGLALLVVAVATRPLALRISRPLEQLTAAARRLGGGDLSARVPTTAVRARGTDELTELTRAFNDMAERVERLVRAEKALLANVSHELRSPLARIRVALELLPRTDAADGRLREVEADLAELDRLIDDVLTMARLEARGLPTRLVEFDARALLDEVVARARHDPLTSDRDVRVAGGPSVRVTGDEGLLRRALWNLVENAAKYGAPPIVLAAEPAEDRVLFSVSDAGPGIAIEDREKVFAPFYRGEARQSGADGDTRRGVGLGLTLARAVAEVHAGTIAVEAADEAGGHAHGCRVVMSIPRAITTSG
jgi:signal transduction histidine kinase